MTDNPKKGSETIKNSSSSIPLSKIGWREYLASKNYNQDVNKMCELCIAGQIRHHGSQVIECSGLASASSLVDEGMSDLFTDTEMDAAEQISNPYAWAAANLNQSMFTSRWYQEMITRCTAKRLTIRCGRRAGKALAIDTPIPTPSGWTTMEHVHVGSFVFDENGKPLLVTGETGIMTNRTCYRLSFSDGTTIVADAEHLWSVHTRYMRNHNRYYDRKLSPKVMTTEEMLPGLHIGSLGESNYSIPVCGNLEYEGTDLPMPAYTVVFILAGACDIDKTVNVHKADVKELMLYMDVDMATMGSYEILVQLGGLQQEGEKRIPREYLEASLPDRVALLQGLMDINGFCRKSRRVEFRHLQKGICEDFVELICGLGMQGSVTEMSGKFRVAFAPNRSVFKLSRKIQQHDGASKLKFYDHRYITAIEKVESVPVKCIEVDSHSRLYLASKACIPTHNSYSLVLRMLHRVLMTESKVLVVTPYEIQSEEIMNLVVEFLHGLDPEYGTYDSLVSKFIKSPTYFMKFKNGSRIRAFTTGSSGAGSVRGQSADIIVLDECVTKDTLIRTPTGEVTIGDIRVGDEVISYGHTLGVNVVTHVKMTGIKDVAEYTLKSGRALTCTPNHPVLTTDGWKPISEASSIATLTVDPNGGAPILFHDKVAAKSKSFLSKTWNMTVENDHSYVANGLITHNCDYMNDSDFNSILAILADNADVELWVASTPNGQSQLHRLEQIPDYKAFHYPSFVLPHYSDKLDTEFRNQFTDIGYTQEVMAEFGEAGNSVFQQYFIDNNTVSNLRDHDVLGDKERYLVFMGGDWNDDSNGTRLIAVAFDRKEKMFFVADTRRVSKEGWTQVAAVQEVIAFNRKYDFAHIYLDEGYGTSNIQFIRQYAIDQRGSLPVGHPDLNLSEIVGVNFSSKVDVIPADGGPPIQKHTKPYLVDNTVRLLERGQLKFDIDNDVDLMAQMGNYIITRRSNVGRPVYGVMSTKVGDHDLDAYMLALFGFSMESSISLTAHTSDVLVRMVSKSDMKVGEEGAVMPLGVMAPELFARCPMVNGRPGVANKRSKSYNRGSFDAGVVSQSKIPLGSYGTSTPNVMKKRGIGNGNGNGRSSF